MVTVDLEPRRRLVSFFSGRAARAVLVPILTVLSIGLLITVLAVVGTWMGKPTGNHVLPLVERELAQIHPPSDACPTAEKVAFSKMNLAYAGMTYATTLRYDELRDHYDHELTSRGWSACGEKPMRDWFRDLGGMSKTYCKGELTGNLQYAGERAGYGWDFAFSVGWLVR
jgi:hypothetical protein